jgi:tripartite-type tricarboxylate transporter receptor subunit TctC
MRHLSVISLIALTVGVQLGAIQNTAAQDWPARPVTMVVPFGAGTSADVLGRILAAGLSQTLAQQVIVENVGGAGGMNGANRVAKAPPDGYQFVLGYASTHAINQTLYKKPLYNAATDFAPVMLVSEIPLLLVTRPNLPVSNLAEFISYVRTKQSEMQYGSSGIGSSNHVVCLLMNSAIGVQVTHIPYRTGGISDVVAGRLDYYCQLVAAAAPQIEGGQLKPLAVLSKARTSLLPNLPTAHEQGLTDFSGDSWNALFLPKRTPAAIVRKLHAAAAAAIEVPTVQRRMQEAGVRLIASEHRSPEYLQSFVESEIKKWASTLTANGVQVD